MTSSVHRGVAAPAVKTGAGSLTFDWSFVLLSLVFVGGLYLDGWAHNHDKVDTSFFTPWHAFFYAGFACLSLVLIGTMLFNRGRGASWRRALPAGYELSLLGVLIFATGGVGDLLWHELFGIEDNVDALLSPTHLVLVLGLSLMVSGPLRAAWQRTRVRPSWQALGPALLALTALISACTFIMLYAHPLVYNVAGAQHYEFTSNVGQIAGVLGCIVTAALLMGPTMLVMRRWSLPAGSLTLVWGVNLIALTVVNYHHDYTLYQFIIMFGAVLLIDMLRIRLQPSVRNSGGWRVFAFIAPLLYTGSYFFALLLTEGSNWSIHMLSGTVVLAGATGWLLSYLVIPPAIPAE